VHSWFEQIAWLDDGLPSPESLRELAAALPEPIPGWGGGDGEVVEGWLEEFFEMLKRPEGAACLRRDAYARFEDATPRVENERSFAVRQDDRLLVGSIDRLVTIFRDGRPVAAEVLDYKTDAIASPSERKKRVAYYRPQLEAYRSAVRQIFHLESRQVTAKLVFVGTGHVVAV